MKITTCTCTIEHVAKPHKVMRSEERQRLMDLLRSLGVKEIKLDALIEENLKSGHLEWGKEEDFSGIFLDDDGYICE